MGYGYVYSSPDGRSGKTLESAPSCVAVEMVGGGLYVEVSDEAYSLIGSCEWAREAYGWIVSGSYGHPADAWLSSMKYPEAPWYLEYVAVVYD